MVDQAQTYNVTSYVHITNLYNVTIYYTYCCKLDLENNMLNESCSE